MFKDDILYAGTLNGKIYKINVTNKTKSTIADLNQKIHSLSFHGNDLYVGCVNKLYKIDF
ncbi:hypothetical protein [Spiroplasma sp. AdecLV25b]|uniref:hypothetical protein n=1 Tax=Spiroplasma sp. AdecLV25b TaxID=3027162 RepID=UPI0027E11834|nr:hypothetical protein [Spiroplasma sp. AdecLV25b]